MRILFCGHARSATGFFSKLMGQIGLEIGHETEGRDGLSSWLHIAPGGWVPWAGNIEATDFDRLVHVVRNPLDVIASSQTLAPEAWAYMAQALGKKLPDDPIERAMFTWVEWNNLIEGHSPAMRIKVEEVRESWAELMKCLEYGQGFPQDPPIGYNARRHGVIDWSDLEKASPSLCSRVRVMAARYGYETENKPVKISACLIVRDEERNLPRCLRSISDVVDEIIVVDTGSVDRTIETAKIFGAKVVESPWRDDFSFHRNESLALASFDWILRIDADEELIIDGTPEAFKMKLARVPGQCAMTRNLMEDMNDFGEIAMSFQQNHFFRRGKVKYVNRKHNKPVFDGPIWQLSGVKTRHYGYMSDQIVGKKERDLHLLMKMREEEPENHSVLFWLSNIYGHYLNDPKKALDYMEQYISAAENDRDFSTPAFLTCSEMARLMGDVEKSNHYLERGLERFPDDVDLNFIKVRNSAFENDGPTVEKYSYLYLLAYDRMALDPANTDGRFTWYFNPEALSFVLHKAAVAHLFKGVQYLEKFREYIPHCSDAARLDLERCMSTDLEKIGVGLT